MAGFNIVPLMTNICKTAVSSRKLLAVWTDFTQNKPCGLDADSGYWMRGGEAESFVACVSIPSTSLYKAHTKSCIISN